MPATPVRGLPGNESDRISIHAIGHNESYGGVPADKIRENIRILHMKQVARIVEKPGYSGGGALDPVALGLLGTGALLALAWRRRSA